MQGATSGPHSACPRILLAHLVFSRHWSVATGGSGKVAECYVNVAKHWGATLQTETPVKSIIVKDNKAVGVRLESGDELFAPIITSDIDPKKTMFQMVGKDLLHKLYPKYISGLKEY